VHWHIYGYGSKPCTPVVHIKIAGKWMFIPLKMALIGSGPYPYIYIKRVNPPISVPNLGLGM